MTVELPKDVEGREIPLDTEVLYDKNGQRRQVDCFQFYPDKDRWDIVFKDSYSQFSSRSLSLTKTDSWEKLEEDLDRCADAPDYEECAYFGKDASSCSSCVAGKEASCSKTAMRDIASRIRKLRGESDA